MIEGILIMNATCTLFNNVQTASMYKIRHFLKFITLLEKVSRIKKVTIPIRIKHVKIAL